MLFFKPKSKYQTSITPCSTFTLPPPFDFFPAMYFLISRRLFCFLRRCQFFRASCFMLILLVRRD